MRTIKTGLFTLLFIMPISVLYAQNLGNRLYPYQYLIHNPAFAGDKGQNISFLGESISYGKQDILTEAMITYDTRLGKTNSSIGLIGFSNRLGPSSESSLSLTYSFRIKLNETNSLILGTQIKNSRYAIDYSLYRLFHPNEPILVGGSVLSSSINIGLGALLKINRFDFGISLGSYSFSEKFIESDLIKLIIRYHYQISDWGKITHSVFSHVNNKGAYMIDLNNSLMYKEKLILGMGLSYFNSKVWPNVNMGFRVNNSLELMALLYSKDSYDVFRDAKFRGSMMIRFLL